MAGRIAWWLSLVVCGALAAYCLYLIFVGTTLLTLTTTSDGPVVESSRLVRVPQAWIPLVMTVAVVLSSISRFRVVWIVPVVLLIGFGFLTGFSIGPPIFLAGILLLILLAVWETGRSTKRTQRPAVDLADV